MSAVEVETGTGRAVCPLTTKEFIDRALLFIEKFSGVTFYTYQTLFARRLVESVVTMDGADITALFSRQSGKSETIANTCVGLAVLLPLFASMFPDDSRFQPFRKGFWAGIYAPMQEQSDISFSRMRYSVDNEKAGKAILEDPEVDIFLTSNRKDVIEFSNGSLVRARPAGPNTKLEGKTYHLLILEEAQDLIQEKVDKELMPMLAATMGTCVRIGTAGESRGGFHNQIQQNIEEMKATGVRNHFEFDYLIVIAEKDRAYEKDQNPFHLNYRRHVDKMIKKLGGTKNIQFRMNYCCEWRDSYAVACSKELMEEISDDSLEIAEFMPTGFQVGGLDIGKSMDYTVLTIAQVSHMYDGPGDSEQYFMKSIISWLELEGSFEGEDGQYEAVRQHLYKFNVQVLVIDASGVGDAFFERIQAILGLDCVCVPYKLNDANKAAMYKYYMQELKAGRIKIPGSGEARESYERQKFVSEHLMLDRINEGRYVTYQAPQGEHDDYPDSAALMAWAEKESHHLVIPEIETSSSALRTGGDRGGQRGDKGFFLRNRDGRRRFGA